MTDAATTALTKPEDEVIGHAVDLATKRVRFLSVSAIRLFDRTEEAGCPRRWWFRYVQGIKEPPSDRASLGVLIAKEVEIYLTTGAFRPAGEMKTPEAVQAVVIAKSGAHLLPTPGADLEVEQRLGDLLGAVRARDAGAPLTEVVRLAGLTAGGIPLAGAADFRHRRGEFVDGEGVLRREDRPDVTTEIGDNKSTRRINDYRTKSGKVYRGYGKTVEQILADTQMLGYGMHEINRNPKVEMLRLGQVYYPTEGNEVPEKRSDLIAVDEVVKRWRRLDSVAREISDVAQETDVAKIAVNLGACNAYFRKCPYYDACPKTADQIFASMRFQRGVAPVSKPKPLPLPDWIRGPGRELDIDPEPVKTKEENTGMSLFNKLKKADVATSGGSSPPVPPTVSEDRVKIEAEKARLRAEDADLAKAPVITLGQVLPPDAPVYDLIDSAAPLKPEVIATITDPEIRAKAEAHAEVHRQRAEALEAAAAQAAAAAAQQEAAEMAAKTPVKPQEPAQAAAPVQAAVPAAAASAKTGGRCPGGNVRRELTVEEVVERKIKCGHCGKVVGVRPGKVAEGKYEATIGGHNIAKDAGALPPAPPSGNKSPEPPGLSSVQKESNQDPVCDDNTGGDGESMNTGITTIFVDIGVVRGGSIQPLSDYYDDVVQGILAEAKDTLDIRCSPDERLAFSKWRGVLAALCKSRPIPVGEYSATSTSEIDMVVVDALRGVRVLRGVR